MPDTVEARRLGVRRLRRRRRLAGWVLTAEQAAPAAAAAAALLGGYAAAALLGAFGGWSGWVRLALLAVVAAGIVMLGRRGVLRVVWPNRDAVDRRLEQAGGLRHRPLAALADRAADGDAALWRAHLRQAQAAAAGARVGWPRLGGGARTWLPALVVLVLLVGGVWRAGGQTGARLLAAFAPDPTAGGAAPTLQAWITPPPFTGLPPRLLGADEDAITVPAGTSLLLEVTGSPARPRLSYAAAAQTALDRLGGGSWQATRRLDSGGTLSVSAGWHRLARWQVGIVDAAAPALSWTAPPAVAHDGQRVRLPWRAVSSYGMATLAAEVRLDARPDLPALSLPIPPPRVHDATGVAAAELIAHPWAGLAVTLRLAGRDVAGAAATSAAARLILPEQRFTDPLAALLVQVRRGLVVDPTARVTAEANLALGLGSAEAQTLGSGEVVNLEAIAALLADDGAPAAADEAVARLWTLAQAIERPAAAPARARLEAARDALQRQLDAMKPGEAPPDAAQLAAQVSALQSALRRRIAALLDAARAGQPARSPGAAPRAGTLDRMLQAMREDARRGDAAALKSKLAALQTLMDKLQGPEGAAMAAARQITHPGASPEQQARARAARALLDRQAALLGQVQARHAAAQQRAAAARASELENFPNQTDADAEDRPGVSAGLFPSSRPGGSSDANAPGQAGAAQAGADPSGSDQAGFDQAGADQAGRDQAGRDQAGRDQAGRDQAGGDQAERDQAGQTAARRDEAAQQRSIREALQALRQSGHAATQPAAGQQPGGSAELQGPGEPAGPGGPERQALSQADRAMGQAEQALLAGQDNAAATAQRQALAALQRGGQAMASGGGQGQPGSQGEIAGGPGDAAGQPDGSGRGDDPFGRSGETADGREGESDWRLPPDGPAARSRLILQELRRRDAERSRPRQELDYIERLLQPF